MFNGPVSETLFCKVNNNIQTKYCVESLREFGIRVDYLSIFFAVSEYLPDSSDREAMVKGSEEVKESEEVNGLEEVRQSEEVKGSEDKVTKLLDRARQARTSLEKELLRQPG